MSKILKPYTIIPANLYVARDADRQIENIINDMGRPGYVLVSRQMGKTNLLLNAKRKLESANDIFVYIDLSNPFDSAKSCFENIINTALEINEDIFKDTAQIIDERRKSLVDTPAHKQHANELRMLLKKISGKLVIILDEIDALTKTPYSDQIFAQIRSVYFSRVNFPEFERLTYILSGVVEPNDIIKDPKISPFNIGQKIFLNDFSKAEFLTFLQLAKLKLAQNLQERIFYWTNGNPRITWDLCSDIENEIESGKELSESDIDKLVHLHYLKLYDKPPVDNIRELVKQEKELRSAILTIRKGQNNISDKLKNKLYLAGIINYIDGTVEIKNKVINESLSVDWLNSIEQEEKGLLSVAVEYYSKENFKESLELFEKYLSDNDFGESENKTLYYFMMGFSAYKGSDFEKAIEYFNLTTYDVTDEPKNFYDTVLLKAICYTYLEKFEEAHYNYKQIIDSGRKDEAYIKSLINYGSVSLKTNKDELQDQALEIFISIGNDIESDNLKIKKSAIPEIKSIAYYNAGIIYSKKGDDEIAGMYFERAMNIASAESKPVMTLALIEVLNDESRKYELLKDTIEKIVANELQVHDFDPEFPLKFSLNEFKEITMHTFVQFQDSLFEKLITPIEKIFKTSVGEVLFEIGIDEINDRNWENAAAIFSNLSDDFDKNKLQLTTEHLYNSLKYACYFVRDGNHLNKFIAFGEMFKKSSPIPDTVEIENFAVLVSLLMTDHQYQEALTYLSVIGKSKSSDEKNKLNYLVLTHLELNIYTALGDKNNRLVTAKEILKQLNDDTLKSLKSNLVGESGIEIIRKNAADTILTLQSKMPVVNNQRKFGRNDLVRVRYKDGVTIESKFKKIENDLNNGDCILLQ